MSDFILVDTDVISYIFRGDSRAANYEKHLLGKIKAIAVQTFAEITLMPLLNSWSGKRKAKLDKLLEDYLIVEADQNIGENWAAIRFESVKKGRPISTADAWIAATALTYSIPLVTHNYKDFKNVAGLTVVTKTE